MAPRKLSAATAKKLAEKIAKNTENNVEPSVFPLLVDKELLAIVGTAPTMTAAPFEDDKYEIWAVGQCATFPGFTRGDVLFELHGGEYWKDEPVIKRLNKWDGRLMMQDHYPEVPKSERFPIETILQYRPYHTTSISYMLAAALHSFKACGKPFHVGLFGIHMEDIREEYAEQRPCCEYWLARMEEAGMDIFIAAGAVLAAPFLYGYEAYSPLCYKIRQRIDGLNTGVNQLMAQEDQIVRRKHEQIGAAKESEYWLRLAQRGELDTATIDALKKREDTS